MRKIIVTIMVLMACRAGIAAQDNPYRPVINLAGEWQFALDPSATMTATAAFADKVSLPGTTDTNRKGEALSRFDETTHLSRLFSYKGRAWYSRTVTIPKAWRNSQVTLFLERTKPAEVYVDGILAGQSNDISTSQTYNLTPFLKPGPHVITVMVDNSSGVPEQLYASSHAYTEDTQTNWNGIIGRIELQATPHTHIAAITTLHDQHSGTTAAIIKIKGDIHRKRRMSVSVADAQTGIELLRQEATVTTHGADRDAQGQVQFGINLPLDTLQLWSEFHPQLYKISVEIYGTDKQETTTGFVNFKAHDKHFYVNGKKTFLRGKHDACVFPLTGHVPMDRQAWEEYLSQCRSFGINHIRFHSWCPPEMCFQVADELGLYLQPELPFWGDFNDKDSLLMTFLRKEGENILRQYGHHPSFVMFALGNELWGSTDEMENFTRHFRQTAPRKLYTFGSNYYLGYKGVLPQMDYFTTCRVGGEAWGTYGTHTRGSFSFADASDGGIINHFAPNTSMTLEKGCDYSPVPVISHETGQFQTYPDFDEIDQYTGVLRPCNLEVFRRRLQQAGMADLAEDFHMASGCWSTQLYKADIELDLRTPNMAGFQLLDLQDYPGQGSAYVGVLNAFMRPKKSFELDQQPWRDFCNAVVPLWVSDKYCFTADEGIHGKIQIANYGETSLQGKRLHWELTRIDANYNPTVEEEGDLPIESAETGLIDVGQLSAPSPEEVKDTAHEMLLVLKVMDHDDYLYVNAYTLWQYPAEVPLEKEKKGILVVRQMTDDVVRQLSNGATVLWMPDSIANTVGPLFQTDYWNYRMFNTICQNNNKTSSPGTLGLFCDPLHPLFNCFPTNIHTDWQWFPVVKASHPAILDGLPVQFRPIVQVIDNVERNHRLALVFECRVEKGRLLVCMSDLEAASSRPEGRQFYYSLLRYMHSPNFQPANAISWPALHHALTHPIQHRQMDELNNISPY